MVGADGHLPGPAQLSQDVEDYALSASFQVGGTTVHHVTDGLGRGPRRSWFRGIDPAEWTQKLGLSDPDTPFPINFGLFVVVSHGFVTLVDSGFGPLAKQVPNLRAAGELLARLAELGIQPEDVTGIVQTHLHADHCGQLVSDQDGAPTVTFPRARVYIHQTELDHWTGPAADVDPMASFVRSRIRPVLASGLVTAFTSVTNVAPGVVALPLAGHTAGHVCVLVTNGGESCFLVGDLAHHPVHFEMHGWVHDLEHDVDSSKRARETLCELAIGLDAVVTAPHMPILTLGRLSRDGTGAVRWSPEP